MRAVAGLCAAALAVAWIVLCHVLMTRWPDEPWNGVVVVGPMLAGLVGIGVQRRWVWLALTAAGVLAALVVAAVGGRVLPLDGLYVAQHVAVHAALAVVFAASLAGPRESLVTALARRVHGGRLTPAMEAYSRQVTRVWAGYFVLVAALSLALYALAPFAVWARFANLVTPLLLVALFVGEHVVRYRLHPEFERASLGAAVRAWNRRRADDGAAPTP